MTCFEMYGSGGKDGFVHAWNMADTTAPTCSYKTGALHFCNSATDSDGNGTIYYIKYSMLCGVHLINKGCTYRLHPLRVAICD